MLRCCAEIVFRGIDMDFEPHLVDFDVKYNRLLWTIEFEPHLVGLQ